MKKLALLCLLCLTASIAWAGTFLGTYYGTSTPPTSSTAGYAVLYPTTRGMTVIATDVRDGSAGDALDSMLTLNAYAWCYNANAASAGANGWVRTPALDIRTSIADAGTGVTSDGVHNALSGSVTLTSPATVDCSRIYYTDDVNIGYDAGVLVHRLTITDQH